MSSPHIYRYPLDGRPFHDDFWGPFGDARRPFLKALVHLTSNVPFLRYVRGKHASFEQILDLSQLRSLLPLSDDRSVAERWVEAVDHEIILDEPVSFRSVQIEELVLADVVSATAAYSFEVSGSPLSFRVQNFLFPTDPRFELLRVMALGDPDVLDRSELSAIHAELVYEAEDWAC
jgi:hypothetical protein